MAECYLLLLPKENGVTCVFTYAAVGGTNEVWNPHKTYTLLQYSMFTAIKCTSRNGV